MELFKTENKLKLLTMLKEAEGYITKDKLAETLDISTRTLERYKRELNRTIIILNYKIMSDHKGYKLVKIE